MTQENKELLLKDLCARLPYDVKVLYNNKIYSIDYISGTYEEIKLDDSSTNYTLNISSVKPYLFPLSSMTEEQKKEWFYTLSSDYHITYDTVDWCNKNHFDYRGLIEKSLALDATGLNIY